MKERIKDNYYRWKYLGYSREVLEQYADQIAMDNINVVRLMLWTSVMVIVAIWVALFYALSFSPDTTWGVLHTCYLLVFTMAATIVELIMNWRIRNVKGDYSKEKMARVSTVIFLSVVDLSAVIAEVLFYPDAYSTVACGMLLISQIMFIAYPIDNLIYISSFVMLFILLDFTFKDTAISIYDLIDSMPFLLVGLVLSWKNSHSRFEILIRTDHEKQLEHENMENILKESRMDIMLTQIQPHFIYNTLAGIGELCHTNPAYAEQAVMEFSCYLRGNLSALNDQKIIPFEHELNHIQHYLYCEKMRFDERLNIVYDIQAKDFSVPTLSLQPIVENAVRYGVSKKEEGGTVTIASFEKENEWMVVIADDGVGFSETYHDDGKRQHIGIQNVRTRLEQQCGGELVIESKAGRGTKVTIHIPKIQGEM